MEPTKPLFQVIHLTSRHSVRLLVLVYSAVLVLFSMSVLAASNPPAPTPLETAAKPQASGTNPQDNPAVGNHAPANPVATVIDLPAPGHDDAPKSENSDADGYSSPEWWLVYITTVLMGVTAALAAFTAKLWKETARLAEDARSTSSLQADQAERALTLTEQQVELARNQHELARWQQVTAHRPRLIIRKIVLNGGDGNYESIGNYPPQIQFTVANIGGSKASIVESNAVFVQIGGELPSIPPYGCETNTVKSTVIEAGQVTSVESIGIKDPEVSRWVRSWNVKSNITNGQNSPFYFLGYIRYSDDVGVERTIAFCRRYNPSTKRFMLIDDPDYEYND